MYHIINLETHTHTHIYIYDYIHIHIHTHAYIYIYKPYIYIYTYKYIYIYKKRNLVSKKGHGEHGTFSILLGKLSFNSVKPESCGHKRGWLPLTICHIYPQFGLCLKFKANVGKDTIDGAYRLLTMIPINNNRYTSIFPWFSYEFCPVFSGYFHW